MNVSTIPELQSRSGVLCWTRQAQNGHYVCRGREHFYHVAPRSAMASIRRQGLQSTSRRYLDEMPNNIIAAVPWLDYPMGAYLFSLAAAAEEFCRINERGEDDEDAYIGTDGEPTGYVIIDVYPKEGTILYQDPFSYQSPFSNESSGFECYSFYATSVIPLDQLDVGLGGTTDKNFKAKAMEL